MRLSRRNANEVSQTFNRSRDVAPSSGIYTFVDKLKVGLQELMAGSRNFSLATIARQHIFALTQGAARVSGIEYVMDACRPQAEAIIDASPSAGKGKNWGGTPRKEFLPSPSSTTRRARVG
ncbi:MAG TPA: hypothetical protein VNE39_16635 [Planctomycetota bacterium]|nr:hypothetical protein [Planctomycetota bacterium]